MANHRPEVEAIECDSRKTSTLPCAILGKPKAVLYPENERFDIDFLVPGCTVKSVNEALRILRTVPSWTSMSTAKITEILTKIKAWKFPVPHKLHNLNERAFKYGLQHFYKYCCIASNGSKLLYDDKYFEDLITYLSEDGYSSNRCMWLSPELICDTLIFIQQYHNKIDEAPAGVRQNEEVRGAMGIVGGVEIVNYGEAKNVLSAFIKELLEIESQINNSVLQFFTNNWLNNMYRGCYQFTSREAFCMYFNNVSIFEYSHHLMFSVPDIRNVFVKRLLIPRTRLDLDEKFGPNPRITTPYTYDDESQNEISSVVERLCGFRLADKSHAADANAMKTLSSGSTLIVRMCPDSSTDSWKVGRLRTIGEILGNGSNRKPVDDDANLFGSRKKGRYTKYSDDDGESDEGVANVKCEASIGKSKRNRYRK